MRTRLLAIAIPIAAALGASGTGRRTAATCPGGGPVINITGSTDSATRVAQMDSIKLFLGTANATVRLGPDVDLDFGELPVESLPLRIASCVTLTSVISFKPVGPTADLATVVGATTETLPPRRPAHGLVDIGLPSAPTLRDSGSQPTAPPSEPLPQPPGARSPHSPGPALRYGKHRDPVEKFLLIDCMPDTAPSDHIRISGFGLFGPEFGPQIVSDVGITIHRCIDVEIANMEIAGWGSAGIEVNDDSTADQRPGILGPLGRITSPDQIRIHGNYIHHDQYPNHDGHALGYGIDVGPGAWAEIAENLFDMNRHSVTAGGTAGGYNAERNLVLKGGGHHDAWYETYTQVFDVHGTDGCWGGDHNCGDAGTEFLYRWNSFQYRSGYDIKIRGMPLRKAKITANVFAREGLEGHFVGGDDAIALQTSDSVEIMANNTTGYDSFGQYGICDFDGDGVDDLFLPTGVTWWFSSAGRFPWSYLNQRPERIEQVRFGYFDGGKRCDVMVEQGGQWLYFSGGQGAPRPRGNFSAPLDSVVFGRFDPAQRDERPGVTLPTTHAFRRLPDGQWQVTTLATPIWTSIASSSFPMSELRFGDFTGDGVTDVLAVVNGRWAISESGTHDWSEINHTLGDPVTNLLVANMDTDDNIDDLLRLDSKTDVVAINNTQVWTTHVTWWRSRNAIQPWTKWREYQFSYFPSPELVAPLFGFAGRFGAGPGEETLMIDQNRMGHFFRPGIAATDTLSDVAY